MRLFELLCEAPVESSWITDITYNRRERAAFMHLYNGKVFKIPNITRTFVDAWKRAPSKGSFYNRRIKPTYNVNRIN